MKNREPEDPEILPKPDSVPLSKWNSLIAQALEEAVATKDPEKMKYLMQLSTAGKNYIKGNEFHFKAWRLQGGSCPRAVADFLEFHKELDEGGPTFRTLTEGRRKALPSKSKKRKGKLRYDEI